MSVKISDGNRIAYCCRSESDNPRHNGYILAAPHLALTKQNLLLTVTQYPSEQRH